MQPPEGPPSTEAELVSRAEKLAGFTLGELADLADIRIPENFKKEKGWTGQLLELWLGAEAGSKPTQDFPELGVELKTIPIDERGRPMETTYVCYAHLTSTAGIHWQVSSVKHKLSRVLWVPIDGNRSLPPAIRSIGTPFIWSPDEAEERALQQDWEELMDMISLGQIEQITARIGTVLQLRPKAANGEVLTQGIGAKGQFVQTRPRGFYLRKEFTGGLLHRQFGG